MGEKIIETRNVKRVRETFPNPSTKSGFPHVVCETVTADVTLIDDDGREQIETRWVRHYPGGSTTGVIKQSS